MGLFCRNGNASDHGIQQGGKVKNLFEVERHAQAHPGLDGNGIERKQRTGCLRKDLQAVVNAEVNGASLPTIDRQLVGLFDHLPIFVQASDRLGIAKKLAGKKGRAV